ncbi:catabolic L-serine/threonine dehydratase [Pseudogymnoascus australis]
MGSITPPASPSYQKLWRETPCIESRALSQVAGCRIFLKLDHLQPSGSFKSRGIGHLIALASARTTSPHFYCSSGGNAGLACATACLTLSHPCTIVVPSTTMAFMVVKLRALGATVHQAGRNWKEADTYMRESVMGQQQSKGEEEVYVPPFDHPDIWEGASSLVPELETQMKPSGGYDGVVCSVGGGGLLVGIADGLRQAGRTKQSRGGAQRDAGGITSIATSLGCVRVAERAYEVALGEGVQVAVLSDAQAAMGSVHLADMERILAEAACGVSVAACFDGSLRRGLGGGCGDEEWAQKNVVVVVCGEYCVDAVVGGTDRVVRKVLQARLVEGEDVVREREGYEKLGKVDAGFQQWAVRA